MNGCHSSNSGNGHQKGRINLTSYSGIMQGITPFHPLQSEIYTKINGSHPSMPPSNYAKLSAKQVEYIKSWIDFGAQNLNDCTVTCDTSNYTYSKSVAPIMTTWCTGCHNASNSGGGYNLTTYSGVVSAITKNRLLGAINQLPGFYAMPLNTGKISDCNLVSIQKWVSAGYPNN
jgi:hypothetical protein